MSMALRFRFPVVAALAAAVLMIGCDAPQRNGPPDVPDAAPQDAPAAEPRAAAPPAGTAQREDRSTVLFLGTSLTAGLGLPEQQAYPARIQEKIDSAGLGFRVVNAGVSGETSAGALRRVEWLLRQPFQVLVLETGANDMLRGADLDATRANIQAIIDRVREERPAARIVLVGMMAPPNLGSDYTEQFARIYPEIAEANDLPLIPFLLEDVGGLRELNLPDGIHPNAEGQRIVAANVWEVLEPVLRRDQQERPAA